jgi:uncharacterized NAD-dependent epimerase/dehydratase family protein
MRGSQPTHLILVHRAGQTHIRNYPDVKIPSLQQAIAVCETVVSAGGAFLAAPVVAIALNTHPLPEAEAKAAIAAVSNRRAGPALTWCATVQRLFLSWPRQDRSLGAVINDQRNP